MDIQLNLTYQVDRELLEVHRSVMNKQVVAEDYKLTRVSNRKKFDGILTLFIMILGDFITASPGKKIVNVKRRVYGDGATTIDAKSAIGTN